MQTKSATQTKGPTERPTQILEQTMGVFQSAMQAGVRMQEESTRQVGQMFTRFGPPREWPKRTQSIVVEAILMAQRNVEETLRVLSENAKRNCELLEKAFSVGPADGPADAEAKARDFWEATMTAMQANAQAIIQANTRMLESWTELGRKLNGAAAETEPAAKTGATAETAGK